MKVSIGILTVLILVTSMAQSQIVDVRSGDHEDFTRVVFQLPSRQKVQVLQSGTEVQIKFGTKENEFNLEDVFRRISNERLSTIEKSSKNDQIFLKLSCNCDVSTFWFKESFFVLDIKDSIQDQNTKGVNLGIRGTIEQSEGKIGSQQDFLRNSFNKANRASLFFYENTQFKDGLASKQLSESTMFFPPERQRDLSEEKKSNIRNLTSERLEKLIGETARPAREPYQGSDLRDETQIRINTASKQNTSLVQDKEVKESNKYCSLANEINIDWDDDKFGIQNIGNLRANIYNERDILSTDNLNRLAKMYLHQGLGEEAISILSLSSEPNKLKTQIAFVAQILKNGFIKQNSSGGFQKCDTIQRLWALFLGPTVLPFKEINLKEIKSEFNKLPLKVRLRLGKHAAKRLLEAGYSKESTVFLSGLERSEQPVSRETQFLKAETSRYLGETEQAQEIYSELSSQTYTAASRALLREIEVALSQETEVTQSQLELAGALASENSSNTDAVRFHRAYILSLALAGKFDEAFKKLSTLHELDFSNKMKVTSELVEIYVKRGDKLSVMRKYFSGAFGNLSRLEDNAALALATFLYESGFESDASKVLMKGYGQPQLAAVNNLRETRFLNYLNSSERNALSKSYILRIEETGRSSDPSFRKITSEKNQKNKDVIENGHELLLNSSSFRERITGILNQSPMP